jgi:transcriptional regulator with XRE-family HTH domain
MVCRKGQSLPRLKRNRYVHDYRIFVERLRAARLDAGFTQKEVAKRLHLRQPEISKCESGERRVDVIELRDFARVYGKKITDFLP